MTRSDFKVFYKAWSAANEIYGKTISDTAMVIAFNALSRHSISQIKKALELHLVDSDNGRFAPLPAHLVKHLEKSPNTD